MVEICRTCKEYHDFVVCCSRLSRRRRAAKQRPGITWDRLIGEMTRRAKERQQRQDTERLVKQIAVWGKREYLGGERR